jgi:hypothetical protein
MAKKTRNGWEKSKLDLDKYLTEPCEIDEEMMLYIQECVPPQYATYEFGQGGDPIKHEDDKDGEPIGFYMTTSFINGKHFYLGVLPEFRQ